MTEKNNDEKSRIDEKVIDKMVEEVDSMFSDDQIDKKRLITNRELSRLIAREVEKQPTARMGQILRNLGVVEDDGKGGWISGIFEEPWETLKRVKKRISGR